MLAVVLGLSACGGSDGSEGQVEVVATTTQIGDWVATVGGEGVDVHQILQPNTDPHDYEAKPSDVQSVAGAELIFANGDDLDHWAEELASDSGSEAEVVELSTVIPVRLRGEGEHSHGEEEHSEEEHSEEEHSEEEHSEEEHSEEGHEAEEEHSEDEHEGEDAHAEDEEGGHDHSSEYDPHWWHDSRNAAAAVEEIERSLAAAEPARAEEFEANADAYLAELEAMDEKIAACIESIPSAERKMVTDHDAFGYFANRYGIEVVGAVIPAQTTQGQPSAKDLSALAEEIEEEEVRAVFPATAVSSSVAEAIARQTGATAEYTLYSDSLGPDGSDGATYIEMEEANADAVVRGLTGGERGCD